MRVARHVALLTIFLIASQAEAQVTSGILTGHYDVDSATYTACRTIGSGSAIQTPVPLVGPVNSAGTTLTAVSGTPFAGLAVGDVLVMPPTATGVLPEIRSIITYTSNTSVVVDTAPTATLTNAQLSRLQQRCGTGDDAGWLKITDYTNVTLTIQVAQINTTTGIDAIVECRSNAPGALPSQVYPDNSTAAASRTYTAAGHESRSRISISSAAGCPQVRVMFKLKSTDDGADTTTARELIDVMVDATRRQ
jgi:hypothetical protein